MKYLYFLLFFPVFIQAQTTQTIKGTVKDKVSQLPIIGATVVLENSSPQLGASTNADGQFVIENVPLGRQSLTCSYIGYETYQSEALIVNSQKMVTLEIELQEGLSLEEVVVKASGRVNLPVNELSVVSTRSFSADETERIAASVNDPGRLALAYPGVSQGTDDNENDIIIRGNSSFGMLWRLEGIDIPNPNHFARPGTSGGGVTVFSAQLLSRSDFSTGGMPAEYGNAISGAMDVHFRKGNKSEKEHRLKIGLLGLDLSTEGPLKKEESSYLVNYRYSTLGILTKHLGVYFVGERVENVFQDLSFNIALDGNEKNRFTIFGLGGLSQEHYNPVTNPTERDPSDSGHFEDRIRDGNMGTLGMTYTRFLDKQSYLKLGVAGMGREIEFYYDVLDSLNNRQNYHDERHNESRISSSLVYNRKINSGFRFKTGIFAHYIPNYTFYKKTIQRQNISDVLTENTNLAIDGSGSTYTFQYFAQMSKDIGKRLSVNVGGHFMLLGLNNTTSIEPRLALKYQISPQQTLGLAYGMYSKVLPMAAYFYTQRDTLGGNIVETLPNQDLPLVKSHHFIASYNFATKSGLRFSAEGYYQSLFDVPVSPDEDDLYWMLNNKSDIVERVAVSDGRGENYGVDLAIEKFFSNRLYFLLTGSFFKSYFYPKNGERYNTTFANDFVSAFTIGREFEFKKGKTLQVGTRILYSGGTRYTPLDETASLAESIYIRDLDLFNTLQIPNYFRIDGRVSYRYNTPKLAGQISLDVQNVTNSRNPSNVGYDATSNALFFRNHTSGLVPVLAFQVDL